MSLDAALVSSVFNIFIEHRKQMWGYFLGHIYAATAPSMTVTVISQPEALQCENFQQNEQRDNCKNRVVWQINE